MLNRCAAGDDGALHVDGRELAGYRSSADWRQLPFDEC